VTRMCARGLLVVLLVCAACCTAAWAGDRPASVNYVLRCAGCHGMDGSGHESAGVPDFRDYVGAFALDEDGRTYLLHVPGIVNASLSDREICAVINYVMDNWGGTSLRPGFTRFTPREVAVLQARPVTDVVRLRRQIVDRLHARGILTAHYPWP
jgi:hypothetical protein